MRKLIHRLNSKCGFPILCLALSAGAAFANIPDSSGQDLSKWLETAAPTFQRPTTTVTNINYGALIPLLRSAADRGDAWAQGFLGDLLISGRDIFPDPEEGARLLRSSAEKGCLNAMARLGCRYLEGDGVKKDFEEALHWLRPAAKEGWPLAQAELGYAYELGLGVTLDYSEAMKWYRRGAEKTNAFATMKVGFLYSEGIGVPRDISLANHWLSLAADLGNAREMCLLGTLFERGLLRTNSQAAEAVNLYKQSAERGDKYGCYDLALCYHKGYGVPINPTNAFFYAFRSATQNLAQAQYHVAESYRCGLGVARDYNQAMTWYTNAAASGDPNGWYSLAMMYNYADVGLTNLQTCLALLLKAAEAGHRQAQLLYSGNCLRGLGTPLNIPEAVRWLKKSAEGGWPDAEICLGSYYINGTNGLPRDEAEGVKWEQRAAEHGNLQAQFLIGTRLLKGDGLPKDPAQGISLLRQAAEHGYAQAQSNLGYSLEIGDAGEVDLVEACVWDSLASKQNVSQAKINLQRLLPRLTAEQREEALRRTQHFAPSPVPVLPPVKPRDNQ